jgi:hypothetical protein
LRRLRLVRSSACCGRLSVHCVHPDHGRDIPGAQMGHTVASTAGPLRWQLGAGPPCHEAVRHQPRPTLGHCSADLLIASRPMSVGFEHPIPPAPPLVRLVLPKSQGKCVNGRRECLRLDRLHVTGMIGPAGYPRASGRSPADWTAADQPEAIRGMTDRLAPCFPSCRHRLRSR